MVETVHSKKPSDVRIIERSCQNQEGVSKFCCNIYDHLTFTLICAISLGYVIMLYYMQLISNNEIALTGECN